MPGMINLAILLLQSSYSMHRGGGVNIMNAGGCQAFLKRGKKNYTIRQGGKDRRKARQLVPLW
jgi:hypothetical protein